jgi:hypothetical protein
MAKRIPLHEIPDDRGRTHHARPSQGRQPPADQRSVDDILAEIRKIYFTTRAGTIARDFDRAIDLLKAIPTPSERQRATVYMEGLAEMRKEWKAKRR